MKRILTLAALLSFFMFAATFLHAQTLVNKAWQDTTGNPHDTTTLSFAAVDGSNYVVVGNTWPTSDSELTLVTKYNSSGSQLWQIRQASASTKRAIVTDLDISNGFIYFSATSYDSTNSKSNFAVSKINDTSGVVVWTKQYNPTFAGYGVPAAVREDPAGNIYVAGTEQVNDSTYEMTILKYNSSGTVQWTVHYDSVGLYSGAVGVGTIGPKDSVNFPVTGYSGKTFGAWDIVTFEVNFSTGSITSVNRVANGSGAFISHPVALAKDSLGNTYVVGASEISGPNVDIKLIKYDSLFHTVWTKTWGGPDSLDDEPSYMVIDANNNLVITGYTSHSSGEVDFLTVKYDQNGNLKWSKTFNNSNTTGILKAQGSSVTLDGNNNIYATGKIYNGSNYDIATLAYDQNGSPLWQKTYDGGGSSNDLGMNISLDNLNNVYISGTTSNGTTRYITMQYTQLSVTNKIAKDSSGNPLYVNKQLLVNFSPKIVTPSIVNNKDWQYGKLSQIIPDSVRASMAAKLGVDQKNLDNYVVTKIFMAMTIADSLSIDRLGDTIHMYPFWSEFAVNYTDSLIMQNAVDSLDSMYPLIQFAEPNYVYHATGFNDTYIDTQASLFSTNGFANANINVQPAWNLGAVGQSYVKVGIFDSIFDYTNEDFGNGTFAGSKIAGGKDYDHTTVAVGNENDFGMHATACAGIVGAISDNSKGISGIAGGDGTGNTGAPLYTFSIYGMQVTEPIEGVYDTSYTILSSYAASAIVEGAANTTGGYGFGLNVENHSWGGSPNSQSISTAMQSCYTNRCVFVTSRGNFYTVGSNPPSITSLQYPACYADDLVLNVGASGNDGLHKLGGTSPHPNGDPTYESMFGGNVDLIAPGSLDIVLTTLAHNDPGYADPGAGFPYFNHPNYTYFSGTSSAAPHVAGAAAALLGLHNVNNPNYHYPNNLDNDDIQHLLKKYATVIGQGADTVGSGRLNLGATADMLQAPYYYVQHVSNTDAGASGTVTETPNITITLIDNSSGLSSGVYYADKYELNYTMPFPLATSAVIIDDWARNDYLTGCSAANPVTGAPYVTYSTSADYLTNTGYVYSTTYYWHIWQDVTTGNGLDQWIPMPPGQIRTDYSLHIYNAEALDINSPIAEQSLLSIYPNPADNKAYVSFITPTESQIDFQILDVTGQLIKSINEGNLPAGSHLFTFDANTMADGIYLVRLLSNNKSITRKLVVNH